MIPLLENHSKGIIGDDFVQRYSLIHNLCSKRENPKWEMKLWNSYVMEYCTTIKKWSIGKKYYDLENCSQGKMEVIHRYKGLI